jgi:hypothetical protein
MPQPAAMKKGTIMDPQHLTDDLVRTLTFPAAGEGPYVIFDTCVHNLGIRVGPTGKRFIVVLRTRRQGEPISTRTVGGFPAMSVEAARLAVRRLNGEPAEAADITAGARVEAGPEPAAGPTFATAMAAYLARRSHSRGSRKADTEIQLLKQSVLDPDTNSWLHRPVSSITEVDIEGLIARLRSRSIKEAQDALKLIRDFFRAAVGPSSQLRLKNDPTAKLEPSRLLHMRTRVFDNEEARAYLMAAACTGYGRWQRSCFHGRSVLLPRHRYRPRHPRQSRA